MTEKGKMLAGKLYDPSDKELSDLRIKAHKLSKMFNDTFEDEKEKRAEIIRELVPDMGENGELYDLEYGKHITIGNNCRIAANVTITGGVTIGNGCVIGAGSVITRDIPDNCLAAGNPCRVIREITDRDDIILKKELL